LPGIGQVAWLAADHLRRELKAEYFAELISPSFSPKVYLTDDGEVRLMKGDFYYWKNATAGRNDLLFFVANEQPYSPEGQYDLSDKVLNLGKESGVVKVITMGGMATDRVADQPKVYGGGTSVDLVKELEGLGVQKLSGGSITGANGLLFGMSKPKDLHAICLLAETTGFVAFDANAAKAALNVLCKLLDLTIDTAVLDRQAKENQEAIQKARELARRPVMEEARKAGEGELKYVS
jgi:uncharacterized protein (TIGR00162 family)